MGIVWTVCDSVGKYAEDRDRWSNEWENNTNIAREVIGLYQLLKDIRDNTKQLEKGSIVVFNDCSKVMSRIAAGFIKATDRI